MKNQKLYGYFRKADERGSFSKKTIVLLLKNSKKSWRKKKIGNKNDISWTLKIPNNLKKFKIN